jgi:hypothetical protein
MKPFTCRWLITVSKSKIDDWFELAVFVCVLILAAAYVIAAVIDSFIGRKNSIYFLVATLVTFGLSVYFGDIRKTRFYVDRYHIHHALYGIILLGVDVLVLNSEIIVLGIVWGLLLSEAKFFVTKRRKHFWQRSPQP